jgi:hypothetical protein
MKHFKYVSLSYEQRCQLEKIMKMETGRLLTRVHSLLLSADGWTIEEISELYQVHRDTVSGWFSKFEQFRRITR